MKQHIADIEVNNSRLYDELIIEYGEEKHTVTISAFNDNHFVDEAIVSLDDVFTMSSQ